jgi:hypothetical protein
LFKIKLKAIPLQAWTGPEGSRRLRLQEFLDNRNMKVVHPPHPNKKTFLVLIYFREIRLTSGPECGGRFMSMKNSRDSNPRPPPVLFTIYIFYSF